VVAVARSGVKDRSEADITTHHFDVERLARTQHPAPSERAVQLIASCARWRAKKRAGKSVRHCSRDTTQQRKVQREVVLHEGVQKR
jgi:hypothetical protein